MPKLAQASITGSRQSTDSLANSRTSPELIRRNPWMDKKFSSIALALGKGKVQVFRIA